MAGSPQEEKTAMPMEVALLQWGTATGGVRLLGRSGDPDVVEVVRRHLTELMNEDEDSGPGLRLVPSRDQTEGK